MSKIASLQSALNQTRRPAEAAKPPMAPSSPEPAQTAPERAPRQANREGKVNVAAWLDPAFKASLRLVQARRAGSLQDLLEEALNDLFAKYDVPQVVASNPKSRRG